MDKYEKDYRGSELYEVVKHDIRVVYGVYGQAFAYFDEFHLDLSVPLHKTLVAHSASPSDFDCMNVCFLEKQIVK